MQSLTSYFRQYVDHGVIARGKEYVDRVQIVNETETSVEARVRGSSMYRVTIKKTDNGYTASCTCPYDFGPYCKHIMATAMCIDKYAAQAQPITPLFEDRIALDNLSPTMRRMVETILPVQKKLSSHELSLQQLTAAFHRKEPTIEPRGANRQTTDYLVFELGFQQNNLITEPTLLPHKINKRRGTPLLNLHTSRSPEQLFNKPPMYVSEFDLKILELLTLEEGSYRYYSNTAVPIPS